MNVADIVTSKDPVGAILDHARLSRALWLMDEGARTIVSTSMGKGLDKVTAEIMPWLQQVEIENR